MKLFEKFGLSQQLLTAIDKLGIETPTEIQEKSIPLIMDGKDVIGESATGSGKTLAFGCGIIDSVDPKKGLQSLILTPTRELAEQVKGSLRNMSVHKSLNIVVIYGGVSINPQIQELRNANVVVATPGRLLDHLNRRTIDLSRIQLLVLDEADRMLDMGFIDDIEEIIRMCPRKRQTLFFSATILPRIQSLANKHMQNPVKVSARNQVDPSKLKQVYYDVRKNMKLSLLVHLIKLEKSELIMVFCNTRRTTDFVVKNLKTNNVKAIAIHGGFTQSKRSNTMEVFNKGKINVLVCTDVAARGLHIDNVTHIYNYEIPKDPTDYVHRIGRTARAGEEGKVINLISDSDHENFGRLQREYRDFIIDRIEKPKVDMIVSVKGEEERSGRGFSRGGPQRGGFSRGGSRGGPSRGDRGSGGFSRGGSSRERHDDSPRRDSSPHQRSAQQRRAGSKDRSGSKLSSGKKTPIHKSQARAR